MARGENIAGILLWKKKCFVFAGVRVGLWFGEEGQGHFMYRDYVEAGTEDGKKKRGNQEWKVWHEAPRTETESFRSRAGRTGVPMLPAFRNSSACGAIKTNLNTYDTDMHTHTILTKPPSTSLNQCVNTNKGERIGTVIGRLYFACGSFLSPRYAWEMTRPSVTSASVTSATPYLAQST